MSAEVLRLLSLPMLTLAVGILLIILVSTRQGQMQRSLGIAGTISAVGILVVAAAFRFADGSPVWAIGGSSMMIIGAILLIRGLRKARESNV